MSVEVTNETIWDIDAKAFSDLGLWVMDQMRVSTQSDLTILFVDPDPIAELHERWMSLEGPTDVMSFPMDELRPGDGKTTMEGVLGDLVICPWVAAQQAGDGADRIAQTQTVRDLDALLLAQVARMEGLGFVHGGTIPVHQGFLVPSRGARPAVAPRLAGAFRDADRVRGLGGVHAFLVQQAHVLGASRLAHQLPRRIFDAVERPTVFPATVFVSVASGHLTLLAVGQVLQRSLEPAVQFLNEDKFAVSPSASRDRFRPLETSTCVSRGWSSAQSHIETASYQRHSAVFKRCLLGHQPLETEVDVPKTQNPPLEVQKHSN
jgi:ssRNA-specific RNase YbeY (16S rRNA maturation enzyme)